MKWDQVAGQWKELQYDIKQNWDRLSEYEIDGIAGKFDLFVAKIQQKYGVAKDEAQRQVNRWLSDIDKRE